MQRFQHYSGNIHLPKPNGFVTLDRFIKANKHTKPELKAIFKELETADGKRKAELKLKLFYFTPCVTVSHSRKYDHIISFTGLAVLDFDHINDAEAFRDALFNNYEEIICAYCSPSKRGVKALISIPVVSSVDEFKQYFWGIADEMLAYEGFDQTSQNPVLPLFLSSDPDLKYRTDYTTWTTKGTREVFNPIPTERINVDVTDNKTKYAVHCFTTAINSIQTEGHPQLRSACIALGGYVSSGYISLSDAIQLAYNLIESNQYLSKGIRGYKQTAEWAINQGTNRQLIIN